MAYVQSLNTNLRKRGMEWLKNWKPKSRYQEEAKWKRQNCKAQVNLFIHLASSGF